MEVYQLDHVVRNGFVPEWFHGVISRNMAEDLLLSRPPGSFLVRVSQSRIGYTLSIRAGDGCRHYMIDLDKNGQYNITGEQAYHHSLQDLVTFHHRVPILPHNDLLIAACEKMDAGQTAAQPRKMSGSAGQLNSDPPELPPRSFLLQQTEEASTAYMSSDVQPSSQRRSKSTMGLINCKKKHFGKSTRSADHLSPELSQTSKMVPGPSPFMALESVSAGTRTCSENMYEDLPGEVLVTEGSRVPAGTSAAQVLPDEYLPPPPFAPGY